MGKVVGFLVRILILIVVLIIGFVMWTSFNLKYDVVDSGNLDNFDDVIISDFNEYNKFMENAEEGNEYKKSISELGNYNEDYFKSKSLAIVYVSPKGTGNQITGVKITAFINRLTVKPILSFAGDGNEGTGKLILAEVNKIVSKIVKD